MRRWMVLVGLFLFACPALAQAPTGQSPAAGNPSSGGVPLRTPAWRWNDVNRPGLSQTAQQPGALSAHPGMVPLGPAFAENLTTFDPNIAEIAFQNGSWQLLSGKLVIKDLGKREAEAREALRVIRDLRLSQRGAIGTPQPVMEYWLSYGQPPQGTGAGLRLLPIETESLKVEQVQGQWCLRDARRILFTFGPHQLDAQRAFEVIRKHGFNHVGYVGQPVPAMIYFLVGPTPRTRFTASRNPQGKGGATAGQPDPASPATPGVRQAGLTEAPGGLQAPSSLANAFPQTRQLSPTNARLPDIGSLGDRVPIDWRQAQVRRDGGEWKLTAGAYTLASFGPREQEAKQALNALRYYRFTEHCLVGGPQGPFSYLLVNGQAPRGLMFGIHSTPFRPETLTVQRRANDYVLADGNAVLLNLGEHGDEARKLLRTIQQQQCDRLCRIGAGQSPGLTFFARTR